MTSLRRFSRCDNPMQMLHLCKFRQHLPQERRTIMEKGMLSVPETTERLSVSGFTVVWLIKAGELKEQRML